MRRRLTISLLALVGLLLTTAVRAQDRLVVVTTQGNLLSFPVAGCSGLQYDAATGGYTIATSSATRHFAADEIKQVYFEDKAVLDRDPYIEPKETDTVNPNYEYLATGDYEVLELDTALCRIKVRFLKEVPQMYVGKVLPFQKDDFGCCAYVLTWSTEGQVADIRFRPAPLEELLYNADLVFTSDPSDPYYTQQAPASTRAAEDGMKSLPPLVFVTDKWTISEDPLTLETQSKVTLQTHFAFKSGPPVRGTDGIRSYTSKVKRMGLVLTGTLENSLVDKIDLKAKKKLLDKETLMKKPIFFTATGTMVGYVPVYVTFSATLGALMQAFAEVELRYAHEDLTRLKVSAGLEYYGEEDRFNPILDFTYTNIPATPDFFALSGTGTFRASPFVRFDLTVNMAAGLHIDLMPFMRLKYDTFVTKEGFYPHFLADAGLNLRGGLFFPFINKGEDKKTYTTPDLFVTKLWEEPKKFTVKDSLNRVWNNFGNHSEWEAEVQSQKGEGELVPPVFTDGTAVQSVMLSDFPQEDMTDYYTIEGMLGGSRQLLPNRAYDDEEDDEADYRPKSDGVLRPMGDPWISRVDKDGNVRVECNSTVPLGYRAVLRTQIVDSLGNAVEYHDVEMPWEIRNFNATYSFAGLGGGSVEYRDGGKYIREVNPMLGIVVLNNGSLTITTPSGTSTVPATADALGILMGCNIMLVNPSLKESPLIAYDEMRWAKDKGLIKGTHLNLGETTYLGYKCKTISVENGMLTYFQNVCLKTDTDGGSFVVTKFEILD
ncbi:MAG: hypothetical protein IJ588_04350 [Prevotella sp.]|nr:hypothetical protein [Prevotella sp.]